MPTFEFTSPEGKSYEVSGPEGATREEAFDILQQQIQAGTATAGAPSATVQAGRLFNDVPRQLGLTGRALLNGVAGSAQIVTEPLRYITDRLTGMTGKTRPLQAEAALLADRMGLPKPETPLERTVQEGASMGFGAMGLTGAAQGAANALSGPTTALVQRAAPSLLPQPLQLAKGLADSPLQQVAGAAGAGLAGQASKEAGGGPMQQLGASVLGGLAGNFAPGAAKALIDPLRNMARAPVPPAQLEARMNAALSENGIDLAGLSDSARKSLQADMAAAMRTGQDLDPAALSRLADFRRVGATPTRGMLTLDPVQITREQNLAKMAANAGDSSLHPLPRMLDANNRALIGNLNEVRGAVDVQPITAGRVVEDAINGTNRAMGAVEQGAWNAAKRSPGFTSPIYPDALNNINKRLGDEALMPFMSPQISRYMEAFQTGQQPFTPQAYANLRSMLSAETAKGGNEARAASAAINALESTPITAIQPGVQSQEAIQAVDRARTATRAKYAWQESTPLVRTALADARTADPEKIAQSFIIGGTVNDARAVAQEIGAGPARETIRAALATEIKKRALSNANDETAKVSPAQMKEAIDGIGAEKLAMFFSPAELEQLRATQRVGALMNFQPKGSAVNNSNSGALLWAKGMDLLNKAPVLGPMVSPALRNIELSIGQRNALNTNGALLAAPPPLIGRAPMLLPGAAVAGSLLAPKD